MAGAAVLSAMGAVRSGGGLVRIATTTSAQPIAAKRAPLEVTTTSAPLLKAIAVFSPDIVAFGPGIGTGSTAKRQLARLMKGKHPLVVDADGLNALAASPKRFSGPAIITPHAGEMARLLKKPVAWVNANRKQAVRGAAKKFGCVCVLKGPGTLVSDGGAVWKNTNGNPGMASGGTGDVLTGVVAATWAQFPKHDAASAIKAACLAVYLHGTAGDIAVKRFSERSLLASDLAETLPAAFKKFL